MVSGRVIQKDEDRVCQPHRHAGRRQNGVQLLRTEHATSINLDPMQHSISRTDINVGRRDIRGRRDRRTQIPAPFFLPSLGIQTV
jgi:hypothetical protein